MYSCYEHCAKIICKFITASFSHLFPSHVIIFLYFTALNSVRLSICMPFFSSLVIPLDWSALCSDTCRCVSRLLMLPLLHFWYSGVRKMGPDSRLLPRAALPRSAAWRRSASEYLLAPSAALVQALLVSDEPAAACCNAQAHTGFIIVCLFLPLSVYIVHSLSEVALAWDTAIYSS
jgi:hypothetical protein